MTQDRLRYDQFSYQIDQGINFFNVDTDGRLFLAFAGNVRTGNINSIIIPAAAPLHYMPAFTTQPDIQIAIAFNPGKYFFYLFHAGIALQQKVPTEVTVFRIKMLIINCRQSAKVRY